MPDLAVCTLGVQFLDPPEIRVETNPQNPYLVHVYLKTPPVWEGSGTRRTELSLTMDRTDAERMAAAVLRAVREVIAVGA